MISINLHEAKTHFSKLVEKASNGETVIVCKRNVPMVEIKAITPKSKFFIGGTKYKISYSEDAFEPL